MVVDLILAGLAMVLLGFATVGCCDSVYQVALGLRVNWWRREGGRQDSASGTSISCRAHVTLTLYLHII